MRLPSVVLSVSFCALFGSAEAGAQGAASAPACTAARDSVAVLWCAAGAAWLKSDFTTAISRYAAVFAMEQRKRSLSPIAWHILIDNLGMGYGMTGALDKSRQVLEYGVAEDPDYPLFRYNLACLSAETGDAKASITHLEEAFARKAHVLRGEEMPNPWTDDSFQRFMRDPQFTSALAKIRPKEG